MPREEGLTVLHPSEIASCYDASLRFNYFLRDPAVPVPPASMIRGPFEDYDLT